MCDVRLTKQNFHNTFGQFCTLPQSLPLLKYSLTGCTKDYNICINTDGGNST